LEATLARAKKAWEGLKAIIVRLHKAIDEASIEKHSLETLKTEAARFGLALGLANSDGQRQRAALKATIAGLEALMTYVVGYMTGNREMLRAESRENDNGQERDRERCLP
jgi:hypothetical protein